MHFILATGWEDGVADLTRNLLQELSAGKRVLWLVSGGSNIEASVDVMDNITPGLSKRLSVLPADERFGPEGHRDSNWSALMRAGFQAKKASLQPVLRGDNTLKEALTRYTALAKKTLTEHDMIIAQLGIGADGHIAGILPDSPASREDKALVASYKSDPYTRLTLTFPVFRRIDHAFVFAFGETKEKTLLDLRDKNLALTRQPAQILKQIPKTCIYNDRVEDD